MSSGPAMPRRQSKRLERRASSQPYASREPQKSTGLTSYMEGHSLSWGETEEKKEAAPKRTTTFRRGRAPKAAPAASSSAPAADDDGGFFSRTISKFRPSGGTAGARQSSFGRRRNPTKETKAKADEKKPEAGGASGQRTVFISCSALIKEVKLCVGDDLQPKLDGLLGKLASQEIPAEQAVKKLMALVGSTVVQQAGLSVMNFQKGILPHGWLEYVDENSNRPYFFNVHTKVTTWYKPALTGAPPPPLEEPDEGDEDAGMISMDCSVDTHNVAMTGFI